MTQFFKQYNSIKPYLHQRRMPPEKERLQSPEERDELNGPVRMHPVRELLDELPELLVETRTNSSARRFASKPIVSSPTAAIRRRGNVWTTSKILPALPLPHHHELCRCVPEGLNRPRPSARSRN